VSELVDLTLRSLLEPGDEVLVPAPDYPLWTAAVVLNGGKAVHYTCTADKGFLPDPAAIEAQVTERTRALVVINPNNPTGAVYPESLLKELAAIAERHGLVLFSDEIYDAITYDGAEFTPMATLVDDTLCVSFGGLSKVYRACGWRVGWMVFTGDIERAEAYKLAVEKLAALRLSSNVPAQWAVQTALGGYQSIHELTGEGGRLFEARRAVIDAVAASRHLELVAPMGAMYAFPSVKTGPDFDDHAFAAELLEHHHILVVPGTSFNISDSRHFRITLLPEPHRLTRAIEAIDAQLDELL
jgi:alanine-synthesizing transaminase